MFDTLQVYLCLMVVSCEMKGNGGKGPYVFTLTEPIMVNSKETRWQTLLLVWQVLCSQESVLGITLKGKNVELTSHSQPSCSSLKDLAADVVC